MHADPCRQLRCVWVAVGFVLAFSLSALMMRAAVTWGGWETTTLPSPEDAPIVIIGSSLTAAMLSAVPQGESLLGDDRPHAAFTGNALDEINTMLLFEQAVANGTPTIMVEVMDFAVTSRRPGDPTAAPALTVIDALSLYFRQRLKRALKVFPAHHAGPVEPGAPREEVFDPALFPASEVPVFLPSRGSEPEWLEHVVEEARDGGLEVVLFVTPLSVSALKRSERPAGNELMRDVSRRLSRLSALGARVWVPEAAWPDRLFADPIHVNRRGGVAFAEALRDWYHTHE